MRKGENAPNLILTKICIQWNLADPLTVYNQLSAIVNTNITNRNQPTKKRGKFPYNQRQPIEFHKRKGENAQPQNYKNLDGTLYLCTESNTPLSVASPRLVPRCGLSTTIGRTTFHPTQSHGF